MNLDPIQAYFQQFEQLSKSEKWDDIYSHGQKALEVAERANRQRDVAKICAQLTSTTFYQGNYTEALQFANRCKLLSEEFTEPSLFIRALYLESAVHRALAGKEAHNPQRYQQAVHSAEQAHQVYSSKQVKDESLKGKVHFNLGAAHADNPLGDLDAASRCYRIAIECFQNTCPDDLMRTNIRLGKVYLLKREYAHAQDIIDKTRPNATGARLSMHIDYLDAQLNLATKQFQKALTLANQGLAHAKTLGAKEDEVRLTALIEEIKQSSP
ncbi:MAG: hypothetical protein LLG04_00515 [Parachlamydia sp.]|nr:hypothetical protein [Parachlamydia sp.]